jgi:hypothetical protein
MDFTSTVECPACGAEFEGAWHDDSMDAEQLDAPPVAGLECPACHVVSLQEYPGWAFMSEAG